MPTYEYTCQKCGADHEAFQRMSDAPLEVCPACNAPALKRRIGRGAGIIFKGGGFYETDFKDRKGSADSAKETKDTGKAEAAAPAKTEPTPAAPAAAAGTGTGTPSK